MQTFASRMRHRRRRRARLQARLAEATDRWKDETRRRGYPSWSTPAWQAVFDAQAALDADDYPGRVPEEV